MRPDVLERTHLPRLNYVGHTCSTHSACYSATAVPNPWGCGLKFSELPPLTHVSNMGSQALTAQWASFQLQLTWLLYLSTALAVVPDVFFIYWPYPWGISMVEEKSGMFTTASAFQESETPLTDPWPVSVQMRYFSQTKCLLPRSWLVHLLWRTAIGAQVAVGELSRCCILSLDHAAC